MSDGAGRHVALLRGINLGGRNKLRMADLAAIFRQAGCDDVRSYIQSGNVVFVPPRSGTAGLAAGIEATIEERHGIRAPVVLRSATEWEAALEDNPFLAAGADPSELHVAFLAGEPARERRAALDPDRSPPDELVLRRREVYLRLPNGVARTRLTVAWLDRTLGTVSTLRNWRTVNRVAEMLRSD